MKALPFPIPFWGGHCAQSLPRKERRAGTSESWERRPGLRGLTSARLWAKQAQDWFVEGYGPAQLIAYPQRGLGHFCHDHWGRKETKAHPWACEGHTTQSGCGEKGT